MDELMASRRAVSTAVRERVDLSGLMTFMGEIAARHSEEEVTFLCIGTDCSTGDSLGPWIGTLLEERGFTRVMGTLQQPCDANRLPQIVPKLEGLGTIIAVDACLGRPESVGMYLVSNGPLIPAQSIKKDFAAVGTYSIAGIVNVISPKPYWTLQSTSLFFVMGMAREITDAICKQWHNHN